MRRLEEQFELPKAGRIRALAQGFESLPFKAGPVRYYIREIVGALEVGLLLSALQVSASLLELFVRGRLIRQRASQNVSTGRWEDQLRANMRLEDELDNGRLGFSRMLSELEQNGVVTDEEARAARTFYRHVRIPLHHGLTNRFVRSLGDADHFELLDDLGLRNSSFRDVEEALEDNSLNELEKVLHLIERWSI